MRLNPTAWLRRQEQCRLNLTDIHGPARQRFTQRRAHALQNKHPLALCLSCRCISLSSTLPPHYLAYSVQLSLPASPLLSSPGGPADGLVPFHNSWSCSYGSGSHVECESVCLKGSPSLRGLCRGRLQPQIPCSGTETTLNPHARSRLGSYSTQSTWKSCFRSAPTAGPSFLINSVCLNATDWEQIKILSFVCFPLCRF